MIDLRLGDCLELMRGIPEEGKDRRVVVTDPPYGVEFRDCDWDGFIPAWIEQARRIASRVVFTTAPTTQWDYPKPDWVACWYRTAAQSRNAQGGFNHWTPVLVYGDVKFKVDTFYSHGMVTATANKGIDHPSPKDIKMLAWILENATNEGDIVVDPFMGSGSTGVASVKLGLDFVGYEINPDYFAVADRRIADAQKQMVMDFSLQGKSDS